MPNIDVADKTTLDETKAAVAEAKALLDSIYALVDTEIATLVTNTKANSTASTSGTLSQKLASIINSLANTTYGLSALKTAIGNAGGGITKFVGLTAHSVTVSRKTFSFYFTENIPTGTPVILWTKQKIQTSGTTEEYDFVPYAAGVVGGTVTMTVRYKSKSESVSSDTLNITTTGITSTNTYGSSDYDGTIYLGALAIVS